MRYAVISKGLSPSQLETEVKRVGGGEVVKTKRVEQIFCEMDEDQARTLARVPGLVLKQLKEYKTSQVLAATPTVESISDVFYLLRSYFNPALTGTGLTVAVLDSGIRKTHEALNGKVVYEANFTDSPTASDVFGHGTQVAYTVAGGRHALGENAGASPGAVIMNIKVIGDEGVASDEAIVLGIDRVCELAEQARTGGLQPTDDLYPNVINLSLGAEDDGDPDNPVRAACRSAVLDYGLDVTAAAGNAGPGMSTVMLPACEPQVIAVAQWRHWASSSSGISPRGADSAGDTKPTSSSGAPTWTWPAKPPPTATSPSRAPALLLPCWPVSPACSGKAGAGHTARPGSSAGPRRGKSRLTSRPSRRPPR